MMLEQMHVKVDALGRLVMATSAELQRLKQQQPQGGASAAGAALPGDSLAAAAPTDAPNAPATSEVADGWAALLQQPVPGAAASGGVSAPAAPAAAAPPKQSSRVMNIVWFFGVYAFFKYLADKDG